MTEQVIGLLQQVGEDCSRGGWHADYYVWPHSESPGGYKGCLVGRLVVTEDAVPPQARLGPYLRDQMGPVATAAMKALGEDPEVVAAMKARSARPGRRLPAEYWNDKVATGSAEVVALIERTVARLQEQVVTSAPAESVKSHQKEKVNV